MKDEDSIPWSNCSGEGRVKSECGQWTGSNETLFTRDCNTPSPSGMLIAREYHAHTICLWNADHSSDRSGYVWQPNECWIKERLPFFRKLAGWRRENVHRIKEMQPGRKRLCPFRRVEPKNPHGEIPEESATETPSAQSGGQS